MRVGGWGVLGNSCTFKLHCICTWKARLTSKSCTLAPELKMHNGFPYISVAIMNNALK